MKTILNVESTDKFTVANPKDPLVMKSAPYVDSTGTSNVANNKDLSKIKIALNLDSTGMYVTSICYNCYFWGIQA